MKKKLEITLSTIHRGSARTVVTLGLDGKNQAQKFLQNLKNNDPNAYRSLKTRIRTVSEYDRYENEHTFRHIGDGIYEFKRNNPKLIRLYAFYDVIGGAGQLILCTNGGDKRSQQQDINRAKTLREHYLNIKDLPNTQIVFEESTS